MLAQITVETVANENVLHSLGNVFIDESVSENEYLALCESLSAKNAQMCFGGVGGGGN